MIPPHLRSTRQDQRPGPPPIRNLRSAFLLFMLAHIPLALVMDNVPPIAGLHAILTLGLGLRWALSGRDVERVAYLGAYIVGAEVLWRMTNSSLPWELGKYALVLVFVLALVRLHAITPPPAPALYFVALLPSVPLTMMDLSFPLMRRELSFNLSGPLALLVCAWFFSRVRLSRERIHRLLLTLVAPTLGIAAIAAYGILTNPSITFTTESNHQLSGGFGPNQVSSALGLGVLASSWLLLEDRSSRGLRLLAFACFVFLATHAVLTYSRGGIYAAVGSILVGAPFRLCDRRTRLQFGTFAVIAVLVGWFLVLPRLDSFTQGTLVARFEQADLTRRDEIGLADLSLWREHPIFGVGPGGALGLRDHRIAAHTELSRLVAEHGVFGALACVLLIASGIQKLLVVRDPHDRAIVAGLLAFTLLFMLSAAMRLAAPSFTFGLIFLLWPSHPQTLAAARARTDLWVEPPSTAIAARSLT